MQTPSFPTRTKRHYWQTGMIVNPGLTRACDACNRRVDVNDPVYQATCHAALLELDQFTILLTGGFDD